MRKDTPLRSIRSHSYSAPGLPSKLMLMLALCLLSLQSVVPAIAQEADALSAANRLIDAMHLEKQFDVAMDMMQNMRAQLMSDADEPSDSVDALARELFNMDELRPVIATLYAEMYTVEELDALSDFYETPLGQKTLTAMPELTAKMSQIIISRVQEALPRLQELIAEEQAGQ